jgi:hypothetical protein
MSVCSIAARATARQSTGSVTEPKTTETVEAKDSPLVAMAPQSADTTSSQEPGPPIPGPVTPDDQVDEEPTPEANSEEDADQSQMPQTLRSPKALSPAPGSERPILQRFPATNVGHFVWTGSHCAESK